MVLKMFDVRSRLSPVAQTDLHKVPAFVDAEKTSYGDIFFDVSKLDHQAKLKTILS